MQPTDVGAESAWIYCNMNDLCVEWLRKNDLMTKNIYFHKLGSTQSKYTVMHTKFQYYKLFDSEEEDFIGVYCTRSWQPLLNHSDNFLVSYRWSVQSKVNFPHYNLFTNGFCGFPYFISSSVLHILKLSLYVSVLIDILAPLTICRG